MTSSARNRPLLPVTSGDPAGVGPWVGAGVVLDPGLRRKARPVLVADALFVRDVVRPRGRVAALSRLTDYDDRPDVLNVLHVPVPGGFALGRPSAASGRAAVAALKAAVDLALAGEVPAIVTGPISKESLKAAGVPHPGHTELLQAWAKAPRVEMLMAAGPLKGLLITRHLPLKDVPARLTAREIYDAVKLTDALLARALGRAPRWIACGLNPHAGDNGLLGREEKRVVSPAVRNLKAMGVRIEGPLPADVAWARHAEGLADACACLYHDQGMIPLKAMHPKSVVNITVGLPFVRTSPGHGTAFDLAVSPRPFSKADPTATLEAAKLALSLLSKSKS